MQAAELELEQKMERRAARRRSQRLAPFDPRALAWLALPPGWTVELAGACSFPAGREGGLPAFLSQAQAAGLARLETVDGRTDFWVPAAERDGLLAWLRQRFDLPELLKLVWEIGHALEPYLPPGEAAELPGAAQQVRAAVRRLARSAPAEVQVPDRIARWGRLASMILDLPQAADWLDNQVLRLLDQGQTGEVIAWLEAAGPLAELAGQQLEAAVRLGGRRLELVYRRTADARHLVDFQERPEQLGPFYHLLNNADGVWALHYFGMGGVGKTMLLRLISAGCPGASAPPPVPYAICRVDFDYISPAFPYEKPGQLLLELAAELRLQGVSVDSLRQFNANASAVHARLLARTEGVYDLATLLKDDDELAGAFQRMLVSFYALINEAASGASGDPDLPATGAAGPAGNRVVLLVLDTCEELAKVPSPEGRLVAVEATFFLLERLRALHAELAGRRPLPFRVIFSGRRLLAQSGYEWKLKPHQAGGKRRLLPPEKSYMALHELRGFDLRDVKRFYCDKKHLPQLSPRAYKAILRSSREAGRSAQVDSREAYSPRRYRYNPFDLDLFADWVLAAPDRAEQDIASGADDPYIEYRIRQRLRQPALEYLLPHLVLLERVDDDLLRRLCALADEQLGGVDFDQVRGELGDQEWIDYRYVDELQTTLLEVDIHLLPRLRRFFGLSGGVAVPARQEQERRARRELAPILRSLIVGEPGQPAGRLNPRYVDAALRLLPPAEAARLWAEVERRLPREVGWGNVERFLEPILAGESEKARPEHPLWAAVRATQATRLLHTSPAPSPRGLWNDVLESLGRCPAGPERDRLALRATFGRQASLPRPAGGLPPLWYGLAMLAPVPAMFERLLAPPAPGPLDRTLPPTDDEQMAAAAIAALTNVLDLLEGDLLAGRVPGPAVDTRAVLALAERLREAASGDAPRVRPTLAAAARGMLGKLLRLAGEADAAWTVLRDAAWQALVARDRPDPAAWLDWRPPASLGLRLALEALRALPATLTPAVEDDLLTWRANALPADGKWDVDRERLAAASLLAELRFRPVSAERLDAVRESWDGSTFAPECLAHELTPPLLVALAEAALALGRGQDALDRLADPAESAADVRVLQAAREAMLKCWRRLRLPPDAPWTKQWVEGGDPARASLAWPAAHLSGQRSLNQLRRLLPKDPGPAWLSLWKQLQPSVGTLQVQVSGDVTQLLDTALGVTDLERLVEQLGVRSGADALASLSPEAWLQAHPGQEAGALRLAFDRAALLLTTLELRGRGQPGGVEQRLLPASGVERVPAAEGDVVVVEGGELRAPPQYRGLLPPSVVERVPARQRAALALDDGELRVLHDYRAGRFILNLARAWFDQAGDPFGALQASVCIALADEREGAGRRVVDDYVASAIHPAYDAVRANVAALPEWDALLPTTLLGQERASLGSSLLADWTGWLRAVLVLRNRTALARSRLVNLAAPLEPPELAFAKPAQPETTEPPTESRLGRFLSAAGTAVRYTLAIAFVLVVLGLFVGLVVALYRGYEVALLATGVGASLPLWLRVVLFLPVAGLFIYLVYLVNRWWAGQGRLDLALRGGRKTGTTFILTRQARDWRLRGTTQAWQWTGPPDLTPPPAKRARERYDQAVAHLRGLVDNPTVRRMPFALAIADQADQALAWEESLAHALAEASPLNALRPLGVHRRVPAPPGDAAWAAVGWTLGLVRVVSSNSAASAVTAGWQRQAPGVTHSSSLPARAAGDLTSQVTARVEAAPWFYPQLLRQFLQRLLYTELAPDDRAEVLTGLGPLLRALIGRPPSEPYAGQPPLASWLLAGGPFQAAWGRLLPRLAAQRPDLPLPCRVLHLVGTPINTPGGLAWQVISASQTDVVAQQAFAESVVTESAAGPEAGTVLTPGRIPVGLASLVILQAEPSEAPLSALLDASPAADLRAFAATLVASGAPGVLVLPPLPFAATQPVVRAVARALRGGMPPGLQRRLQAAQAARQAIARAKFGRGARSEATPEAGSATAARDQQTRLALQVALFIRSATGVKAA